MLAPMVGTYLMPPSVGVTERIALRMITTPVSSMKREKAIEENYPVTSLLMSPLIIWISQALITRQCIILQAAKCFEAHVSQNKELQYVVIKDKYLAYRN